MRQNRRRYAKLSVSNRLVGIFMLSAVLITTGAVASVTIRTSISKLGKEIKRLEAEKTELRNEMRRAEASWSNCANPENLAAALARHGINMELAKGERIVSLRGMTPRRMSDAPAAEVAANDKQKRVR